MLCRFTKMYGLFLFAKKAEVFTSIMIHRISAIELTGHLV